MPPRPERAPVWVAVLTCVCAGVGLVLNHLMVGDPEAFTLALLIAAVAVGIAAWQVWGRSAPLLAECGNERATSQPP